MAEIPPALRDSIFSFLDEIKSICSLDKVVLFGSIAKGKYQPDSDIDLAIFSKSATDRNRLEIMSKIFSKVPKYKLDIQPLVFSFQDFFSTDNTFIQNEIKTEGIALKQ